MTRYKLNKNGLGHDLAGSVPHAITVDDGILSLYRPLSPITDYHLFFNLVFYYHMVFISPSNRLHD